MKRFACCCVAGLAGLITLWPLSASGEDSAATRPAVEQTQPRKHIECPAWAKETVPDWVQPFLGRFGLPDPYPRQKDPIGDGTECIDFWQANHFVAYRPETAGYLYRAYSPTKVHWRKGTLPVFEKLVAECTAGRTTAREKVVALLTRAMPKAILHPSIPPYGPMCTADRGFTDEQLFKSHIGYCNEQARVFTRLCQIAGIPARMIFLFYADKKSGHVITEFFADGHWAMADSSWWCVFPGPDGKLMTAAECHTDGPTKQAAGQAYYQRVQELLTMSDEQLAGAEFAQMKNPQDRSRETREAAERARKELKSQTAEALGKQLWAFGVMNYPLPQ